MKLTRTLLIAFAFLALASVAQAVVIETVEWESKAGGPWSYTGPFPEIDCTMPVSPSGGCALKFTFPAGTYSTSFSGGRAERAMSGETDLYLGHWSRYSNPFTFNDIATKFDLMGMTTGLNPGSPPNFITVWRGGSALGANQIAWDGGTVNWSCNLTNFNVNDHLNEWVWVELHFKLNTPGGSDGIYDLWFNDIQCAHYTNIPLRDSSQNYGYALIQHTAEWGGGGGTIPTTGYWWVDHTVISTTRIGRPGSLSAVGDSTPPSPPVGLRIQ